MSEDPTHSKHQMDSYSISSHSTNNLIENAIEHNRNLGENIFFESIIDNLSEYIYVLNPTHTIVLANRSLQLFLEKLDLNPMCEGLKVWDAFPFLNEKNTREVYTNNFNGTGELKSEKHYFLNGQHFYFKINKVPITDSKGKINKIIVSITDLTKEKRIEEQLRTNQEKYKLLAENSSDIILSFNRQMIISYISPSVTKLTGYETSEFLNQSIFEFIKDKKSRQIIMNHRRDIFNENLPKIKLTTLFTKKNGDTFWAEHVTSPVYNEQNILIGFITNTRDITEERLADIELNESRKKLQELNKTKDQIISIVAHDLRNPFNNLMGFSDLLLKNFDKYTPDKIKRFIQVMRDTSRQGYYLLENLLAWNRTNSGSLLIDKKTVNLYQIIEENIMLAFTSIESKAILLKNYVDKESNIYADERMISTVIRNLLSNAIKFTPTNGEISFQSTVNETHISLTISDNGVGMSRDRLNKLFKPSELVSKPGTEQEQGTGLGLLICKEFIEKNDGSISVDSKLNIGTTFSISLPIG